MAKILIVDDYPANREFLFALLRHRHDQLLEAGDGEEALAVTRAEHPDLVITDLLMPRMDGYEFLRQVRSDPELRFTQVIFYSAKYQRWETEALGLGSPVAHYLEKPSQPQQILLTVEEVLSSSTPPSAIGSLEEFDRTHLRVVTDKLARKVQALDSLNRLGRKLALESDPARLLETFCSEAREILRADHAALAVCEDGQRLRYYFLSGLEPNLVERVGTPALERALLEGVARATHPKRWNRARRQAPLEFPAGYPQVYSFLCVPLESPSRHYGGLCFTHAQGGVEFTEEHEKLAATLGLQLAVAYENARRFETLAQAKEREWEWTFNSVPDLIAVLDVNNRVRRVNRAMAERLGRTPEECVGQLCYECIHGMASPPGFCPHTLCLQDGRWHTTEMREQRLQGDFLVTTTPLRDEHGQITGMVHVARDISARKRAEAALRASEALQKQRARELQKTNDELRRSEGRLRESEQRLRLALATARLGVYERDMETDKAAYDAQLSAILGLAEGVSDPEAARQSVHPEDRDRVLGAIARALNPATRQVVTEEYRIVRPDGEVRWLVGTSRALFEGEGTSAHPVKLLGVAQDITERKLMERELGAALAREQAARQEAEARARELEQVNERLRASEERFRLLVEGVKDYAIYMLDREGRVTTWNAGAEQLKGYTAREIIGQHFSRFFTPEDVTLSKPARELALAAERGQYAEEGWRVRKDGSRFWASVTLSALRDAAGELRGFAKVTKDLSESRQALAALRQSEAKFRALFEHAPEAIFLTVPDGRITAANPTGCTMFGMSEEELITGGRSAIADPHDAARMAQAMEERERTGQFHAELNYLRKNGERFTAEVYSVALPTDPPRSFVIMRDITKRKRAEDALRRQEKLLRMVLGLLPVGVWIFDAQGRMLQNNPAASVLWSSIRHEPGEAFGEYRGRLPESGHFLRPADWPVARALARGESLSNQEIESLGDDGRARTILVSAQPIRDREGLVTGAVMVDEDITPRKEYEKTLRQQNRRLHLLNEAAGRLMSAGQLDRVLPALFDRIAAEFQVDAFVACRVSEDQSKLELQASGALTEQLRHELRQVECEQGLCLCGPSAREHRPLALAHVQSLQDPRFACVKSLGFHAYFVTPLLVEGRLVGTLAFGSRLRDSFTSGDQEFFQALGSLQALAQERVRLVTELKGHAANLESTVDERTAKLRELLAELEHMSYSIIHDMRAPLRAIHGYATVIEQDDGPRLSQLSCECLTKMKKSVSRMDLLITDALSYNKAVREELPVETVDAAELIRDTIRSVTEFQSPQADIRLAGDLPLVLANRCGLAQCVSNLLGNAVKFVRPGQRPQIRIRAERSEQRMDGLLDKWIDGKQTSEREISGHLSSNPAIQQSSGFVRIWFEDNGVGIPKGSEQKIFGMFQRMHGPEYPGTGIGLALVRKLMERMGGRVGFESEPNQGSRFWLEFRTATSAAANLQAAA